MPAIVLLNYDAAGILVKKPPLTNDEEQLKAYWQQRAFIREIGKVVFVGTGLWKV